MYSCLWELQSYGASPAIWDHTGHPSQVSVPRLNPSHATQYSIYTPEGWKAELTLVLVIYQDGLPVHRQSPILVVTT